MIVMISVGGCFSARPADIEAFLKPSQTKLSQDKYFLYPPDEIKVYCAKIPEIHEQIQQIRPDGTISFETIGTIKVVGKTPEEVAQLIKNKLIELYSLPGENPIDVRVERFQSQYYHVFGQVMRPGPKICTGRDTLLMALSEAQPTVLAWKERVQVIRPSADTNKKPKIFEVNFKKLIVHGDASKNVLLQEGDIIYVPPTILAAIGMKVEELVRPIGSAFSTINIVSPPTIRNAR